MKEERAGQIDEHRKRAEERNTGRCWTFAR